MMWLYVCEEALFYSLAVTWLSLKITHVYLICFSPQIPSALLNIAEPEASEEAPRAPKKISSHPLNFFSLCSLTRDSSVIYPQELQRSGPQSAFCFSGHSASSIIFPDRADSKHQFKAPSRLAPASAVALGNRPLSRPPPPPPAWGTAWAYLLHSSLDQSERAQRSTGALLWPWPISALKQYSARMATHVHINFNIECTLEWRYLDLLWAAAAVFLFSFILFLNFVLLLGLRVKILPCYYNSDLLYSEHMKHVASFSE